MIQQKSDNLDPIKTRKVKIKWPKVEHGLHLVYFIFVAVHGPYHYVAAGCFVVGVLILTLHLED